MHSFAVEGRYAPGQTGVLSAEESAHAARVLRLAPGTCVRLIDMRGHAWEGELTRVDPKATGFCVKSCAPHRESPVRITLYQGLPKADKLELITQKCTELGVYAIVPVEMRYSVAKAGKPGKDSRLARIAAEAVKQCGRSLCPVIEPPLSFAQALAHMQKNDCLCMPYEEARECTLSRAIGKSQAHGTIGILIGPEGGISPEEAQAVLEIGGQAVTLGQRILRTETAAIASVALALSAAEALEESR